MSTHKQHANGNERENASEIVVRINTESQQKRKDVQRTPQRGGTILLSDNGSGEAGDCHFIYGPNVEIISWLEEVPGGDFLMNAVANPAPPALFTGPVADDLRSKGKLQGRDITSVGSFLAKKEYRSHHQVSAWICCKDGRIVQAGGLATQGVGYTPLPPRDMMGYSQGESGPHDLTKTQEECCYIIESKVRFRVGWLLNAGQAVINWSFFPWVWSKIRYTLCCDGTCRISFGGSYIPSHNLYIDGEQVAQHSMAGQPNAQQRVEDFKDTGGGNDAPGEEVFQLQ